MAVDSATRDILETFADAVRQSRRAWRWTQARLAAAAGISQAHVARIERADVAHLSFRLAGGILRSLGGHFEVRFVGLPGNAPVRDQAHARSITFVAGRLERAGLLVALEVDVGTGRWPAFADIIAFDRRVRVLYVIEVKTEIHDIGAIDRQLGVAERGAWTAAKFRGWRPWRIVTALLVLATSEVDRRLEEHRAYFDQGYRIRAAQLLEAVGGDRTALADILARRGQRALAMIDPRSRRKAWLRPTRIDGRRAPAPYVDRMAYLAGPRSL